MTTDIRAMTIVELQASRIAVRALIDDHCGNPTVCGLLWERLGAIDREVTTRQDAAERRWPRRMAAQR